ncbi:MAG: hypothetical protein VZS44_05200 [Bacilli bacterium]|nr:hypothetical protein [Bacilli bacterium]
MSLNDSFWEGHLDKLKDTITEVVNNNMIGPELQIELLDLYNELDNKKIPLEVRKQRAVLVEHYLGMCKNIINNGSRRKK